MRLLMMGMVTVCGLPLASVPSEARPRIGQCFETHRWLPAPLGGAQPIERITLTTQEAAFPDVFKATLAYRVKGSKAERRLVSQCRQMGPDGDYNTDFTCAHAVERQGHPAGQGRFWFRFQEKKRILLLGYKPGLTFTVTADGLPGSQAKEIFPFAHDKDGYVLKRGPAALCR